MRALIYAWEFLWRFSNTKKAIVSLYVFPVKESPLVFSSFQNIALRWIQHKILYVHYIHKLKIKRKNQESGYRTSMIFKELQTVITLGVFLTGIMVPISMEQKEESNGIKTQVG